MLGNRQEQIDRRWWKAPKRGDAVAHAVHVAAEFLSDKLRPRHDHFLTMARMYGNLEIAGLGIHSYSRSAKSERLTCNVVASCIDTATAKIAKNKPAPQFLTNGADYDMRRKAEKLNKFGKGLLHQSGMYRIGPAVFRDACLFGTGFVKEYAEGNVIRVERTFPWEILIDDAEAMYGEPRQLIQRKFIDRAVLLDSFGTDRGKREAIQRADPSEKDALGRDKLADQLEVFEGWHLPSSKGAGDGRHVICIEDCVLVDEEWKRMSFPFAKYTLEDPICGFWGIGMAERLMGIQLEINRLLQKIQKAMHLLGVPRVILPAGAGVPKTHLNNEIGAIITVNGGLEQAPTVITPQTVHPEAFAHLDRLYERAFQEVGLSQLTAHGEKPAGINSGIGLRELTDIESDRFVINSRRLEELHIDVVRLGLEDVRGIRNFTVDVPDRDQKVVIAWKDVDLDEDAYVLQCFPVSLLPQTPAGRLERVQELFGAGFIDQDAALELLDVPDLEDAANSRLASIRAIRSRVGAMLDGQDYVSPEPFDNLQLITSYVPRVYLHEREHGCPEERLADLRRYIEEASFLMEQAAQAAQAQQLPAPGPVDPAMDPTMMAVQGAPDFAMPMAA